MIALPIELLPPAIKEDVDEFLETHPGSPAARLRPKIGMVGDVWLVVVGSKLRKGNTGLGNSPITALEDFNRNFLEPIVSRNGSEPS
jgi:hypothetical protein